ncbi:MAG: hypothetical protein ABSG89_01940 [Bacteroidales bacterium]|jgi:hypothetical protein
MDRKEFTGTLVRAGLAALLAFIAIALGKKVAGTVDCSSCPGNGICRGSSDCSKYLAQR